MIFLKRFLSIIIIYNVNALMFPGYTQIQTSKQIINSDIINEARQATQQKSIDVDTEIKIANKKYILWRYWIYKSTFNWHFISSIIIFIIVVIMVFSGLYFSYLQLEQSLLIKKISNKESDDNDSRIAINKISFATNKIEISSSVIGLVILTISFAFFYLYIVYVYPVSVESNEKLLKDNQENIEKP